uniref:Testis-expressed protein 38 n=1 Tax=Pogona vitticeps TaxID=103695 RepID=A0A6J0UR39_9SAUR
MAISSDLLPTYFGCLGLWYVLVFGCMLLFHWRKRIHGKRRARAWVKQLKAETYFQSALDHTAKKTQPGAKVEVYNLAFDSIPKLHDSSRSNETMANSNGCSIPSIPDPDPCKPVFQEVPCACVLSHLPPLLEHSASYPCSKIPVRSTPYISIVKSVTLKNGPFNIGSSISS